MHEISHSQGKNKSVTIHFQRAFCELALFAGKASEGALKRLFNQKLFFRKSSPIYRLRRKKRAPIALRGPKWLQNDNLKIFRVLYITPYRRK